MNEKSDYLVIGAGISGAAAAAELAECGSVTLVDMEERAGYHSSGRSAALYTPNYGPSVVRTIIAASAEFYRRPIVGFADHPLMTPRQSITFVPPGSETELDDLMAMAAPETPLQEISADRACKLAPLLKRETVARAFLDPHVMDMDASAIHQGFLKLLKHRGGRIFTDHRVTTLDRKDGQWHAKTTSGAVFEASIVVNAGGAWADEIGQMAGAKSIGLVPMRRTAIIIASDSTLAPDNMPMVDDGATEAYLKLDAGRLMASLGDATPSPPCDSQPEDLDIAMIVDWLERHTHLSVKRIDHSWAGLRSFVTDHCPVVGFDNDAPDFFWLVGQGGYGIMLAAALGRLTRSLIEHDTVPVDMLTRGLNLAALSPSRCRT